MSKRKPLEVGQRVWMETSSFYSRGRNEDREAYECEVVEANKSSAYAVPLRNIDKYKKDTKRHSYMRRRIIQRNHSVKSNGLGERYDLWLTKDAFENNIVYIEKLRKARKKAHEIVDGLTLAGLENLIKKF